MRSFRLLILVGTLVVAPGRSQSTLSPLPDVDYAVLTTALDYLSGCDDPRRAHRRGDLVFIKSVTLTQSKHGFYFNFTRDREKLSFLLHPAGTFYTQPDWVTFLASVDSAQFTRCGLEHPLKLACRESQLWTPRQDSLYFGSPTSGGHGDLRKQYPNYGGLVSFSTVAYSSDGREAVCYCAEVNDYKDGSGNLLFLERRGQQWVVVGNAVLWIS